MINITKLNTKNKLIGLAIICLIVVCGVFSAHRYLWLFSPAYSQRQTTSQFFSDISKGNTDDAFKLTSNGYQMETTYSYFLTQLGKIKSDKTSITYVAYATSKDEVAITGYINDKTINERLDFAINLVASKTGPKVNSIVVTPSS